MSRAYFGTDVSDSCTNGSPHAMNCSNRGTDGSYGHTGGSPGGTDGSKSDIRAQWGQRNASSITVFFVLKPVSCHARWNSFSSDPLLVNTKSSWGVPGHISFWKIYMDDAFFIYSATLDI